MYNNYLYMHVININRISFNNKLIMIIMKINITNY